MTKYEFIPEDRGVMVMKDLESGYSAYFSGLNGVSFKVGDCWVTGRDIVNYPENIGRGVFDPSLQYLEVGCGLGGFIPYVAGKVRQRPIAIDPVNYGVLKRILEDSLGVEQISDSFRERTLSLLGRVDILLDSGKVRLINKKLGEALRTEKDILGCADVVVDSCGASLYPQTEGLSEQFDILNIETKLLRDCGHIITSAYPKFLHGPLNLKINKKGAERDLVPVE